MKTVLERKGGEFLVVFSDGCGGQNKNKSMNFFCQKLIEMGIYKSVDHIFLQRGHMFLPHDKDFSSIELRKRKEMPLIPK